MVAWGHRAEMKGTPDRLLTSLESQTSAQGGGCQAASWQLPKAQAGEERRGWSQTYLGGKGREGLMRLDGFGVRGQRVMEAVTRGSLSCSGGWAPAAVLPSL